MMFFFILGAGFSKLRCVILCDLVCPECISAFRFPLNWCILPHSNAAHPILSASSNQSLSLPLVSINPLVLISEFVFCCAFRLAVTVSTLAVLHSDF